MKRDIVTRKISRLAQAVAQDVADFAPVEAAKNVDLYIEALLRGLPGIEGLNDPEFFVRQLRASFMPYRFEVLKIKGAEDSAEEQSVRFSRLINALSKSATVLPAPVACEIARTADAYLGNPAYILHPGDPIIFGQQPWAADVAWAFNIGSSSVKRGRLLYTTVRFMRPSVCVEAGSFLGISAFFILSALERYSERGRLHTIEVSEPIHSVASDVLKQRFGDMVTCHCGETHERLSEVVSDVGTIDFFFHDNGHSRDDYVRDFEIAVDSLRPGSVVMYDDIRWGEGVEPPPRCYEGWREVVSHSRVERAFEMGSELGLILLG